MTSGAKSEGRFGKQDFVYCAGKGVYRCPAGQELSCRYTSTEDGKVLHRYWTSVCGECALKPQCTTGPQRRVARWEHEHVLEAVQERLDKNPEAMRVRRETAEHPFGTLKSRMGTTPLLAQGRYRDGAFGARLQFHPRDEYHRRQAADGCFGRLVWPFASPGRA